ncbi:MAG: helix-turn-helix transcriptional regulator [Christensenellaceae bacterium]|nr:helix-turn-helix transcriptional regulator [Christensenellaceae bacterium]
MELGQRLRQARLEAGLSQRQLCGDVITRNMLSQIENGSARPSMDTLRYLAEKLGKTVSYFLEEQAVVSPNREIMGSARSRFSAGEYSRALESLEGYKAPDPVFDPEKYLLETLSLMGLARQQAEEKPVYARELLEKAHRAGSLTPYFTAELQRQWILTMAKAWPEHARELAGQLESEDEALLLRAQAALEAGDPVRCAQYLEAAREQTPRWQLLRGQAALAQKDHTRAKTHFHAAEEAYPTLCAQLLETCYRELEDYKMAYYYACKQRKAE